MMPLSRTVQALVSSISNSAPAAGSRIDSGTKLAAVVAWREGARRGPARGGLAVPHRHASSSSKTS